MHSHFHAYHPKPPLLLLPWQFYRTLSSSLASYTITLLPGDGIGPEVISFTKDVLVLTGSFEGITYEFREMLLGGTALDATGVPMPDETLAVSKQSDAVLLGAIGGYKWDKNEKHLKSETGLLQLRPGLQVFANLRPATVFPQLVDASTLKKEVAEGVDLMVVREPTGGVYILENPGAFGPMKMAKYLTNWKMLLYMNYNLLVICE